MQHKHLFVLSAFYSGSTLLTALLGTSPKVSILKSPEHEGMKLPGVRGLFAATPAFRNKPLPWAYLDRLYRRNWDISRPILVEKGAYIKSAGSIANFYPDASFIVLVRNPYAWCESMRRRRKPNASDLGLEGFAIRWLEQCAWQIHNIEVLQRTVFFTYEDLCDRTQGVLQKLYVFMPELDPLDASGDFQVHSTLGRKANPITNTNASALARLNPDDIRSISAVLSKYPDILEYFGYELMES
jgi:hypothetical protein